MVMNGSLPPEQFPAIGTVQNPAVFYDGVSVHLCYEIAPIDGGGVAILKFKDVIDFRINPMNVEGLHTSRYPVEPWSFTEISGSDKVKNWKALKPRFWSISFNDETIEILFNSVEMCFELRQHVLPNLALRNFLNEPAPKSSAV